jgi:hypothetical protein
MTNRTFDLFTTALRPTLCAFALCAGASLAAESLPYNYVDVNLISVDSGGGSETGFGVDGSYSFNDMFYGIAQISDVDSTTTFGAGAGLRAALSPKMHIFGELSLLSVDFGAGSETGFALGGGLRGMVTPSLELLGRIDHVDFDAGSDQSLTVGGVYYFDRVGVGIGFTSNDGADTLTAGVRFTF